MKRIVLKFGLIAASILAVFLIAMMPLAQNGTVGFENQEVYGYSAMLLAFLMVFFGIRAYREEVGKGAITFGRAMRVGILITLLACAGYVVTWEIYYYTAGQDFLPRYTAHVIEGMRADGATEAAIAKKSAEMASFAKLYENPLINIGITFLEIFPLGLVVTLISSAILRRKTGGGTAEPVPA
jgi:hypothetical protein